MNRMQIERSKDKLAWLYDRTAGVTRSVHTLCIDAFGIRFGASGHDSERVRYQKIVAVSRCSILTPSGPA
ncbi:MAG: hypothetical protein WCR04_00630 [Fibrobacteraceae bacterium]